MGWLSFEYGTTGELYWDTVQHLDTAWTNQYQQGVNGDGTLFYPGLAEGRAGIPAIGGQHDIPIESIRMKRIREGREDYEMLKALSDTGLHTAAMAEVTGLLGSPDVAQFSTTASQAAVNGMRCTLYTLLAPSLDGCLIA